MIKNLRFLFLSMLVMLTGTAFAGTIVFGELGLENSVQYADPFDGGDFTVTFAGGGNNGKYYDMGSGIRLYGDGTMIIEAKSGTLTKIVITFDGSYKPADASVVDGGTYDVSTGVWTGNAAKVVFTRPTGSGHWRVQKITSGDNADEPGDEPQTEVVEATCAQVVAGTDGTVYKVKGTVKNISNTTYGNWDLEDETGSVYIYGTLDAQGNTKNFTSLGINEGDIVTVQGPRKTYNDKVELVDVTVLSIEHTGEQPTEPVIEGGTTPETAIGIEAAINAINTMADKQKTTASYYVKGIVTEVTEISTNNGNATFVMAENFGMTTMLTIFRAKGLEKQNITDENYLKQGDEVVVYGQLQRYIDKEGIMTPEMAQGCYIYSINGRTKDETDDLPLMGEGTKDKPYTVEDVKHITAEKEKAEGQMPVWVRGYIVGNLASANAFNGEEKITASNIALAATAEETLAANCVPVELKAKTSIREKVNLLDNPSNKGKEVLVCGYLLQYFSETGLKDVVDIIMDGQSTSGIGTIAADGQQQEALYNLNGQRIGQAKKGLYVQKGRKFVVK